MIWPLRRRKKKKPGGVLGLSYDQAARHREALRAVEKSNDILHRVEEREGPVNRVSASLKQIGVTNHFADLIYHAFKGT